MDYTKEKTFSHWKHFGQTPRRLIENFAARNRLNTEQIDLLVLITEYAIYINKQKEEAKTNVN